MIKKLAVASALIAGLGLTSIAALVAFEFAKYMHIHAKRFKFGPSAQIGKVDDKGAPDDVGAHAFQQFDPSFRRATRCQQVVNHQYFFRGLNRVVMDFHNRFTVLQGVILFQRRTGQFAFLADRHKPDRQLMRDGATQDEPTGLKPDHTINALARVWVKQLIDANPKSARIRKEGCHIPEHDAFMWKIGDGADIVFDGLLPVLHLGSYVFSAIIDTV